MKRAKRASKKFGEAPGTLIYVGRERFHAPTVTHLHYTEQACTERVIETLPEGEWQREEEGVHWIEVSGIHERSVVEAMGERFHLHPLVLEDVMNTHQRPKVEDYDDYLYAVMKVVEIENDLVGVKGKQVSLILGKNYVITFVEEANSLFIPVRSRIQNPRWRQRRLGADYLFYSLIDCLVDHFFVLEEQVYELIERVEEDIVTDSTPATLKRVYKMKRFLIEVRKQLFAMRDMIRGLGQNDKEIIQEPTRIYLMDVYDHCIRVTETFEVMHEMLSNMVEIHLSTMSNRLNEVMKFLTLISTIFIPLSFVAGVYGMNFMYMPELHWRWGYPVAMSIMSLMGGGLLWFFKRKRWI